MAARQRREVNLDAHLIEAHERAHAHAPGQQRVDSVLGQILDGRQAAALLVRQGWKGGMPGHRAVFQLHDGVQVAMTEMHAHAGIQAAGLNRGNGQNGLAHVAILCVQG